MEHIHGSGFRTRVSYDLSRRMTAGVSYSYDDGYESRVSGDIRIALGPKGHNKGNNADDRFIFDLLSKSPENRDVRVHDDFEYCMLGGITEYCEYCQDSIQDYCDKLNLGEATNVFCSDEYCTGCCLDP